MVIMMQYFIVDHATVLDGDGASVFVMVVSQNNKVILLQYLVVIKPKYFFIIMPQ